jgi:hypothetical protein
MRSRAVRRLFTAFLLLVAAFGASSAGFTVLQMPLEAARADRPAVEQAKPYPLKAFRRRLGILLSGRLSPRSLAYELSMYQASFLSVRPRPAYSFAANR